MKFFDQKEEVLDIQLTKYGKYKLSQGNFKPQYYAFFDENVVYDAEYIGTTENKNSAEVRIQDETPSLRAQGNYTGRDEFLFDGVNDVLEASQISLYERMNTLKYPLGTSTLDSTKTPAFKMRFLEGEIDTVSSTQQGNVRTTNTGSSASDQYSQQVLKIPQIDMIVEYQITAVETGESVRFEDDPALTSGRTYTDGAEIKIGPEQVIVVVEEENAPFDYENFDMEVFEITDEVGVFGEQILKPLKFVKPITMVENNILLDPEEAAMRSGRVGGETPPLDPTFVEYFFSINVDSEISENQICKSLSSIKSKDLFNDIEITCPDLLDPVERSIYNSDGIEEACPDY